MNFVFSILFEYVFVLVVVLFCVGFMGVLVRRNVMFVLMLFEVMMNVCGFVFVVVGACWV